MSDLRRQASDLQHSDVPRADSGTPGKRSLTASLAGRPQVVFRVESAEAAAVFADAFGPRDRNGVADGADAAVDRAAGSSGSPLPEDLRGRFESSLGADLSTVRVHTGSESAEASHAVGAKAYTTGQDIHFGAGHYDPSSAFGVHLLAHEVAHTVQQQGAAPTRQNKLEVSAPQDSAELEADRAADAMVAGQRADLALASQSDMSRKLHREPAADAGTTGKPYTWYQLKNPGALSRNASEISLSVSGPMHAAIVGTGALPADDGEQMFTELTTFCSEAHWARPDGAQKCHLVAKGTGVHMGSNGEWNINVEPILGPITYAGAGNLSTITNAPNASTGSSTTNTGTTGVGATATGTGTNTPNGVGSSGGLSANATSSAASANGGSSAAGGGVSTASQAPTQRFTGTMLFKVSIRGGWKPNENTENIGLASTILSGPAGWVGAGIGAGIGHGLKKALGVGQWQTTFGVPITFQVPTTECVGGTFNAPAPAPASTPEPAPPMTEIKKPVNDFDP